MPRATRAQNIKAPEPDSPTNAAGSMENERDPSESTTLPDRTSGHDVNMVDHASSEVNHEDDIATPDSEGMDCFGADSRRLISVIQRLEALKIDSSLVSLPKFVVVGDQSHGKSSIVEAICDITLPRDEGTCTRCPFQITTSCAQAGTPWTCRISLVYRYAHVPPPRGTQDTSHWQMKGDNEDVVHFTEVTDRSKLEHMLRLAQVAILTPNLHPHDVLRRNDPAQKPGVDFSPNIIRLDIQAPGIAEISFFDLPGAINVVHDRSDDHLVPFIENLIKYYVKDTKTLVLLAVASNQDVNNSTAYRFVHNAEADARCMGVLTKPDIMAMNEAQVSKLFSGEWFALQHGWFTAKQPSQDQLKAGISHARARELEDEFFNSQAPWCTSLKEFSSRFGTRNLQSALSAKLREHILNELPGIMERVKHRLRVVEAKLEKFPQQAQAPCQTVSKEIDRLQTLITKKLLGQGHGSDKQFRNTYKETIRSFRTQIAEAMPEVVLTTPGYQPPVTELDGDDDEEMDDVNTPSKARKKNNGERITSQKQVSTPQRANPRPMTTPRSNAKSGHSYAVKPTKTSFTLDQLKKEYEYGSVSSDLPNQLDAGVTDNKSMSFVKPWSAMMETTLSNIKMQVGKMIKATIDEILASRNQTRLYEETCSSMMAQLDEAKEEVTSHCRYTLSCETLRPISYDTGIGKRLAEKQAELRRNRLAQRVTEFFDIWDHDNNKATALPERNKRAADPTWVHSTLGIDSFARELDWIAIPLTYYEVASRRFVDNVATNLEYGLIHGLDKSLKDRLESDLQVTNVDHCAELLAEDPQREKDRADLHAEQEKLLKALHELKGLPMLA